jgi:hypothetical protein
LKARGAQLRGEAKTKLRPLVETSFNFESSKSKATLQSNRRLVEDLLKESGGFLYKARHQIVVLCLFADRS